MSDLPRAELMAHAEAAIRRNGGPTRAAALFKFTCGLCGERCTLREPNTLHENGECWRCGAETPITVGGYALFIGDVRQLYAAARGPLTPLERRDQNQNEGGRA